MAEKPNISARSKPATPYHTRSKPTTPYHHGAAITAICSDCLSSPPSHASLRKFICREYVSFTRLNSLKLGNMSHIWNRNQFLQYWFFQNHLFQQKYFKNEFYENKKQTNPILFYSSFHYPPLSLEIQNLLEFQFPPKTWVIDYENTGKRMESWKREKALLWITDIWMISCIIKFNLMLLVILIFQVNIHLYS